MRSSVNVQKCSSLQFALDQSKKRIAICQSRCAHAPLHIIERKHANSAINGASTLKRNETSLNCTNRELFSRKLNKLQKHLNKHYSIFF
jgi:hypothetical protein